jgi:ABC transport system ATP-binding/permease protein
VADFAEVFLLLERATSVDWADRFHADAAGRRTPVRPRRDPQPEPPARGSGTGLVQFGVLCRRTLDVLLADRLYLAFLALLPVMLSGLAYAVPSPHGLSGVSPLEAEQVLLVLVLGGALMGMASSMRELVKERSIYLRERAIGLSSQAYLAAKITVLGLVALLQAAAFAVLSLVGRQGPDRAVLLGSGKLEIGVAVVAATLASMVVGLLISTLISNADRGMPLLVVVVMLQMVLSGGLFALGNSVGLDQLSWVVPARWAYAMGMVTMNLRVDAHGDALWRHSATTWEADALVLGVLSLALVFLVGVGMRRYEPRRRRS